MRLADVLGACIRGIPKYRKVEDIKDEKIEHLLWGREGSYFEKVNRK